MYVYIKILIIGLSFIAVACSNGNEQSYTVVRYFYGLKSNEIEKCNDYACSCEFVFEEGSELNNKLLQRLYDFSPAEAGHNYMPPLEVEADGLWAAIYANGYVSLTRKLYVHDGGTEVVETKEGLYSDASHRALFRFLSEIQEGKHRGPVKQSCSGTKIDMIDPEKVYGKQPS